MNAKWVMVGMSVILSFASELRSEPVIAPPEASAKDLRQGLGLRPSELASMGVTLAQFETLQAATTLHLDQNRETLAPLLNALTTAEADLKVARLRSLRSFMPPNAQENPMTPAELRALKDAECSTREAALQAAQAALLSACAGLRSQINAILTENQRTLWTRSIENHGLEIGLKFLALNAQQREALRHAQRARDLTLYERATRQNKMAIRAAVRRFDEVVEAVLTEAQQEQRLALDEARRQNRNVESAIRASEQAES